MFPVAVLSTMLVRKHQRESATDAYFSAYIGSLHRERGEGVRCLLMVCWQDCHILFERIYHHHLQLSS